MDWPEALNQISVLIVAWVAMYGIDSWRREHAGRRRLELAEDSLALFYEAADAIRHMRHPVSYSNETDTIERGEGESDKNYQARKNASVVFVRYNEHQELFNRIHSMRYRFMAQIGKDEAKPFDELRNIVNEIVLAAQMLARLWPRNSFPTTDHQDKHRQMIEKYEAVFWVGLED
jgi:hypothetical protein